VTDSLTATLVGLIRDVVSEEIARQMKEWQTAVEWLTLEQAAPLLHTTPEALRKRAQRGQLAGAVRDGARWLVERGALESALMQSTIRPDHGNGRAAR
jgi:hypothetical protein